MVTRVLISAKGGLDSFTLSILVDQFLLPHDFDLDKYTYKQLEEILVTFVQGLTEISKNITDNNPLPAADELRFPNSLSPTMSPPPEKRSAYRDLKSEWRKRSAKGDSESERSRRKRMKLVSNSKAEGDSKSERNRRKRIKFVSNLKDDLWSRAPDAGFHPDTISTLIDKFLMRFDDDGLDIDTHCLNLVKEQVETLIQGTSNSLQNLTKSVDEKLIDEDKTEDTMRLLISKGYKIIVVDIKKQPKDNPRCKDYHLPKIATLNLVEEQLPVSVGLFRLGSVAYMIGGQAFPTDDVDTDTYRLSLLRNGTLSPSPFEKMRLCTPKLWPVVAEIEGKLHVFDSFPPNFKCLDRHWSFSHEVFSKDKHLLLEIDPYLQFCRITSHLVLGNHIFAVTADHTLLLFDSVKLEWNSVDVRCGGSSSRVPMFFESVWDILSYGGEAKCVQEIMVENVSYYLVLALVLKFGSVISENLTCDDSVPVVAYLVTSKGVIVGRQALGGFFNGHIVKPRFVITRAIIMGGGKDGKTMCVALTAGGIACDIELDLDFFFSNTFTVELLDNLDSDIKRILKASPKHVIGMNLVRFEMKDMCVYKIKDSKDGVSFDASTEVCFF